MSAQSVLFDVPGPRARARYRVVAVLGALLVLGLLYAAYRGLDSPRNSQWTAQKWTPFLEAENWSAYLLPGLANTLRAAALAVLLSLAVGLVLGVGRLSSHRAVALVAGVLVEFFRAIPVLIMMLFSYYFGQYVLGIRGAGLAFFGVVAGLTFYNSAVIAELLRSGVAALPRGQREAGLALGLTPGQALRSVLLPQAVTAMLPSLISQLVVVLKDTALGYIITYSELLRSAQIMGSGFGNTIPALMVAGVLFIVLNLGLTAVASRVERRLRSSRRGPDPVDPRDTTVLLAGGGPAPAAAGAGGSEPRG